MATLVNNSDESTRTKLTKLPSNVLIDKNNLQYLMQKLIYKDYLKNMTLEQLTAKLKNEFVYMSDEFHELLRLLPFKDWKHEKYEKMSDEEWMKDFESICYEMIDMQFFFCNMQNIILEMLKRSKLENVNVSESAIDFLYMKKFMQNLGRISSGDFDSSKKNELFEDLMNYCKNYFNVIDNLDSVVDDSKVNTYVIDIDATLLNCEKKEDGSFDYDNPVFNDEMVKKINRLVLNGDNVVFYTSRGMKTYNGDLDEIEKHHRKRLETQLAERGVKYNELIFGNLYFSNAVSIDNRSISVLDFLKVKEK